MSENRNNNNKRTISIILWTIFGAPLIPTLLITTFSLIFVLPAALDGSTPIIQPRINVNDLLPYILIPSYIFFIWLGLAGKLPGTSKNVKTYVIRANAEFSEPDKKEDIPEIYKSSDAYSLILSSLLLFALLLENNFFAIVGDIENYGPFITYFIINITSFIIFIVALITTIYSMHKRTRYSKLALFMFIFISVYYFL